jgi:hypothetical protein
MISVKHVLSTPSSLWELPIAMILLTHRNTSEGRSSETGLRGIHRLDSIRHLEFLVLFPLMWRLLRWPALNLEETASMRVLGGQDIHGTLLKIHCKRPSWMTTLQWLLVNGEFSHPILEKVKVVWEIA